MLANRDAGVLGGLYAFDAAVVVAAFFAVARAAGPVMSVWRVFLGYNLLRCSQFALRVTSTALRRRTPPATAPLSLSPPKKRRHLAKTSFAFGRWRWKARRRGGHGDAEAHGGTCAGDVCASGRALEFSAFFRGLPHRRNVPPRGYFQLEPALQTRQTHQTNNSCEIFAASFFACSSALHATLNRPARGSSNPQDTLSSRMRKRHDVAS